MLQPIAVAVALLEGQTDRPDWTLNTKCVKCQHHPPSCTHIDTTVNTMGLPIPVNNLMVLESGANLEPIA